MNTKFLSDLAERALAAYLLAFLGLLLAAGFDYTDLSALKAAGLAAIPAFLQVLYGSLAGMVGDPRTAGFVNTREN